jgi:AraC family transcriptional regulator, regulatory protein of adaptative response / methylphosphotriester-DNA alkyltransferase methyltransferase
VYILSAALRALCRAAGIVARVEQDSHSTPAARRALFDDAVAIVRREYTRDLRPQEVARRIATSRRQLQRVFAEIGHTTFSEYLTRVRLDAAAELLRRSDPRPLREIARAVGYRSPSGFAVAFRRHYGVPPGMLRARRPSTE